MLNDCGMLLLLVMPTAVSVDAVAAIRDAARLVSATEAVRHG